ncbi:MAG TPA: TerB family tellurite resistance protein [Blastocatellia bacterium]|nr:TerB family tellurite resistance protein [Blastocatellia bacterium]
MSEKTFKKWERSKEEEYFHKKEQELIGKMRQRQAEADERRQMAVATGVADEEVLNDLQGLGYTRETVSLLHLAPLVQVAWVDGQVQTNEREQLIQIARLRGITEGSSADRQLAEWLDERPSEEFFQRTLHIVHAMLDALSPAYSEASRRDLVAFAIAIAAASGGILGLGDKISDEERAAITRIARELESNRGEAAKGVLGK